MPQNRVPLISTNRGLINALEADGFIPLTKLTRSAAQVMRVTPDNRAGDEEGTTNNTVGTLTGIGASGTAGYTQFITDDYFASGQLFTLRGGPVGNRDDAFPGQGWRAIACTHQDGTREYVTGVASFMTDATTFDLWGPCSAAAPIRVMIDGRYISRTPTFSQRTSGGYYDWFHVVLPTSSPRRYRRVDMEFMYTEGSFRGIGLPAGYLPQPVSQAKKYRIALFGDSLGAATGCSFALDGFGPVAGRDLGGVETDMVCMSLGGTGFTNPGPVNTTAIQHINDLDMQPYDELWIEMGINDANNRGQVLKTAALQFFQAARIKLPTAPIIVLGIARDDSTVAHDTEVSIKQAFDQWADHNSAFFPEQTTGHKLFTGNQSDTVYTSNFAAAVYGGGIDGADNTHPNTKGHRYYGQVLADARRSIVL